MVNEIIRQRKSIISFLPLEIEDEKIQLLFEAASLAPSSRNEQPWSFIIAKRKNEENFNNLLNLMNEKNQLWAKDASLIAVAAAKKNFTSNDKLNKHYFYDVSSAVANLTYQAVSMGLFVHQVGGFNSEKARLDLNIPDGYDPVVMLAIGYNSSDEKFPNSGKPRKSIEEFVFDGQFGNSTKLRLEILSN